MTFIATLIAAKSAKFATACLASKFLPAFDAVATS